jgi:PAS domain S-box-containing protein
MTISSLPDIPAELRMSALIGAKDWSNTILGPADRWPSTLTLMLNAILASGFPMAIRWGPDLVMLYNDGYRPILGDKHSWALGSPFREVWPEVQSQLAPLHEAILAGKRGAFFAEDLLLRIQRHGSQWEDGRFTVSYSPIPDPLAPSGVGGVLITAVETTNRVLTEEALRASEERFAGIFRQSSVGIVQSGLDGRFLLVNKRFCEIVGRSEEDLLALRINDITHPDDREGTTMRLRRLVEDGIPIALEKRYLRPDDSEVWVSNNVSLVRDANKQPLHTVAVIQDITEKRRFEEQQALLMRELNHRVRNLFALTHSVISLSVRTAHTAEELGKKITGRLEALAHAHELILPEKAKQPDSRNNSASLESLLKKILAPYVDPSGAAHEYGRVVTAGPPITMGPRAATSFALILHEFATNAAKYGALSVPAGKVEIAWSETNDQLILNWREKGGPTVSEPTRKGFGTVLSDLTIRGQFGGKLAYHWNPEGLDIDLSCVIERLVS